MRWQFYVYFVIAVLFFIFVELLFAGFVAVGLDAAAFVGNSLTVRLAGVSVALLAGGVWLKMGILFSLRPSHFRNLYFQLFKAMIEAKLLQLVRNHNKAIEEEAK